MPGPEAKTDSGTPTPSKTGVEVGVEDSFGYGDGVVAAGSDAFYDDGNGDFRVVGGGEAGEPGVESALFWLNSAEPVLPAAV